MGREQVMLSKGDTTYIKPKDLKVGTTISGTYRGSFEDKYEKLNHKIGQDDGTTKVINGTGLLNALLEKVAVGAKVDIVYKGKSQITSGQYKGTDSHSFDVFVINEGDKENETVAPKVASNSFPF